MHAVDHVMRAARRLLVLAILGILAAATSGIAAGQGGASPLNVDDNGVILHGYDAVSFQAQQQPAKGTPSYSATHEGAIYHFASARTRDTFKANPAKYAPAYGGYCAMGVAVGKKLDGDPAAFTVSGGRLFLNVNGKVRSTWAKDIQGNELKAQKNWPRVRALAGFDTMKCGADADSLMA